ncbi:MAG: PaaI family thioesterase [Hyphomicrobiales bacterium]|nr:PaaI family thioesterase [Hyphomicrobiales bacterium]
MKISDVFGSDIPFVGYCGIEPVEAANGRSRLEVTIEPHHGNQMGVAHGGLLMTLLDVCMGSASRTAVGCNVVTVDMQVAFMAPASGRLVGQGRVTRAGKSLVFVEADITNAAGDLVCRGTAVFKTAREPGAKKI